MQVCNALNTYREPAHSLQHEGRSVLTRSRPQIGCWDNMEEVIEGKDYSFPNEEHKVLELWDKLDAFKEQLRRTEGKPEYIFYDGPPFATGLPHYGHILAGTLKVVPLAVCASPAWRGVHTQQQVLMQQHLPAGHCHPLCVCHWLPCHPALRLGLPRAACGV